MDISRLRREYPLNPLKRSVLSKNPIEQLKIWLNDASDAELIEPNAMILCTAEKNGRPSSRTVLLKGIDERGLVFFTNYKSRKAAEIEENPFASATFLWIPLARQAVVEGSVVKTSEQESRDYFSTRPRESQLSVYASRQGRVAASRGELEMAWEEAKKRFEGKEIPLPDDWGGYRLAPDIVEFWQGRPHRLHDRFRYRLDSGSWIIERLCP